jgi:hypothetical protein
MPNDVDILIDRLEQAHLMPHAGDIKGASSEWTRVALTLVRTPASAVTHHRQRCGEALRELAAELTLRANH